MKYNITEHRHRFSVWAAARAAQRGFTDIDTLRLSLEQCGIIEYLKNADFSSIDQATFDSLHRQWCLSVMDFLKEKGVQNVYFGRAAKLIAMYLKSVVILGSDSESAFSRTAHPPIDKILLKTMAADAEVISEHKSKWKQIKWTQLEELPYYELISQIRASLPEKEPFWMIERFWTVTDEETV